ncbi:Eukaryotic initiation factor 4A-I [Pelomyxa schiedti]|nr:Eukaryotic initiation factor 4A-I [Pelomyxa schiedti]
MRAELQSELRDHENACTQTLSLISDSIDSSHQAQSELETEINSCFEHLISVLQSRKACLIKNSRDLHQSRATLLQQNKEDIREILQRVNVSTTTYSPSTTDFEIGLRLQDTRALINELVHREKYTTSLIDANATISELCSTHLEQEINNFGSIRSAVPRAITQEPRTTPSSSTNNTACSFDEMGLSDNVLRGIYAWGFETPSLPQRNTITGMMSGRDILTQAQPGTGKTAAFVIPCLQTLDVRSNKCQVLVLVPSHELALQVHRIIIGLGAYLPGLKCMTCIGATSVRENMKMMDDCHIVVGTPGRVCDMINRKALQTNYVKLFILDEGDILLSRSFKDQIYTVFTSLPTDVQVGLFSSGMPKECLSLTERFMREPIRFLLEKSEVIPSNIKQFHIEHDNENQKFSTLCDLYEVVNISQSVIFCNTKRKVDWLVSSLGEANLIATGIHGDMAIQERNEAVASFRSGATRVLVTTDQILVGIDVAQVSVVLNYDLPNCLESYVRRVGRCGRFGRKGVAITLISLAADMTLFHELEEEFGTIPPMPANIEDFI